MSDKQENVKEKFHKMEAIPSARMYYRGQFHQRSTQIPKGQKRKKTAKVSVFFALSGSVNAKVALRTLMKLTPRTNSIKNLVLKAKLVSNVYAKAALRTLMKLTPRANCIKNLVLKAKLVSISSAVC